MMSTAGVAGLPTAGVIGERIATDARVQGLLEIKDTRRPRVLP